MASRAKPLRIGCVGLGGYAANIARLLAKATQDVQAPVQLTAVCDPALASHQPLLDELAPLQVAALPSIDALLATDVEAVWLPVPIDLHRPFTEQALRAGKAVMCEKPAAGCIDDVDAMIAARDAAGLPVAIGYQDIYEPSTGWLKRRLVEGAIGKVTHATLWACWPRGDDYYNRATWAGALQRGGTWVLDSPANNALSHYLNLALFLLGPAAGATAEVVKVEAELYRARPITCFDTCGLRVTTATGATLLVLLSHACRKSVAPVIELHGDAGRVVRAPDGVTVYSKAASGEVSETRHPVDTTRGPMVRRFARMARGEVVEHEPVATLEVSRAASLCVSAAVQAAPIVDLPADPDPNGLRVIPDVEALFEQCAARNELPSESGKAPWSQPARSIDTAGYRHFAGPAPAPASPAAASAPRPA